MLLHGPWSTVQDTGYSIQNVGNKMPRNKKAKVNKQLRAAAAEIEIDYGRLKAANTKYFSSPFHSAVMNHIHSVFHVFHVFDFAIDNAT
ncbi:hypothetical protein ACLKA6_006323 [Drosophila palustris]